MWEGIERTEKINEQVVIDWLKWKATTYGIPGLSFKIDGGPWGPVIARIEDDAEPFGFGETIEDAVTMLRSSIKTPQMKADELRQQASKLLEESNRILGFPKQFPSQGTGSSQEDASAAREGAAGSAKDTK